jgi:hypothetical protein
VVDSRPHVRAERAPDGLCDLGVKVLTDDSTDVVLPEYVPRRVHEAL